MSNDKIPVLDPRKAMKTARKRGWTVEAKRRSGDIVYFDPVTGNKYTSKAPGRADRVPLRLAKALHDAAQDED